ARLHAPLRGVCGTGRARVYAARGGGAGVDGAGDAIVAVGGRTADADPVRAPVAAGTRVAVVARGGVGDVHAAAARVAEVVGARVAVVAERGASHAHPARAHVGRGAGVAVVAGPGDEDGGAARAGAVAGAVGTGVRVGAGCAGRLEPAGRRAAVSAERVAVVALLAGVERAVATEGRDPADQCAEQRGADTALGESRP